MTTNTSTQVNKLPFASNGTIQDTDGFLVVTNPNNVNEANLVLVNPTYIFSNADLVIKQSTPSNSSANVLVGSIWSDNNYIYICIANNTIKRIALSSF